MINNIKMRGTQKRRIALLKYWLPKKFRKLKSKRKKTIKKTSKKKHNKKKSKKAKKR
jgi:hypothetical protein